ncbi:hypothetical protein OAG51_02290 [Pirellulaceae bacterium]|nr:hypothetical protein [Mariniblastus sp.]MDB4756344.1 hypothetical protein [Mariniblastus sp.]MDB4794228.1 hypothetical protein [Pirellulaceae bacterium]
MNHGPFYLFQIKEEMIGILPEFMATKRMMNGSDLPWLLILIIWDSP